MAKRFSETVNLQPVNISTGAAQAASSLSDRLGAFSQQLSSQAIKGFRGEALQRGEESGQSVQLRDEQGQLQTPEFKERKFIGGIEIEAHNKALRARYLAELNNDNRVSVSGIAANNPSDIQKFNSEIAGYRKGLLDSIEPSARVAVAEDLDNMITSSRVQIQSNGIQKQRQENIEGLANAIQGASESAANLQRNGDSLSAGEALLEVHKSSDAGAEAGYWTQAEAESLKDAANQEVAEQTFRRENDQIIDEQGIEAAFARLDELDGKPAEGFSPDSWDTLVSSMQADVNQARIRQAQLNTQVNIGQERQISNLKIQANTGTGEPSDILKKTEEFFDNGIINEAERTSIRTSLIKGQQREIKAATDMSAVSKRLAGNDAVVVGDKIADQYYEEVLQPSFEGMAKEEVDAQKVNYVNRMKRIPKALKDQVNTFIMSGDPILVRSGIEFIDKVDSIPGVIEDAFSNQQRAFGQNIIELSANMEPAEAVALATQLTDPTNKARIEAIEATIRESKTGFRAINYRDIVDDHFDPVFGSTKVGDIAGDQLAKEYEQQYEALLKSGYEKGSAKEKSLQLIGRNWNVSEVTGRVMKYRPDDYYSVNGSVDYIRPQLAEEVNRIGAFPKEIPVDRIFLQATEATARSATGNLPAYRIVILDDDGTISPFYGQDGKGLWFPDMQAEIDRVQIENEKAARAKIKRAEKVQRPKLTFTTKGGG